MTTIVDVRRLYLGSIEPDFKVSITADVELTDDITPRLSFDDRTSWEDADWDGADVEDDDNSNHTRICKVVDVDVTEVFVRPKKVEIFAKVNNVIFSVGHVHVL